MVVKVTLCYIFVTKSRADNYNVTKSIISHVCEQSETSVRLSVCERPSSVTGTRPHTHALTRRAARPPASLSASLPFSSLSFSSIFPFKLSAYSRLAARGPLHADRSARRRTDHRISNFFQRRAVPELPWFTAPAASGGPQLSPAWAHRTATSARRKVELEAPVLPLFPGAAPVSVRWNFSVRQLRPHPNPSTPTLSARCPGTDRPAPGPEPREAAAPRAFVCLFVWFYWRWTWRESERGIVWLPRDSRFPPVLYRWVISGNGIQSERSTRTNSY